MTKKPIQTVLVTGAAGAVGRQVVRMSLQRGFSVVAADRPGSSYPKSVDNDHCRVVSGDLTSESFREEIVTGVDAVVHAADSTGSDMGAVNVEATRRLYEVARRAGAAAFVQVSCGTVYRRTRRTMDERAPMVVTTDYGRTRVAAEQVLRAASKNQGPLLTILRTGPVFGPGSRGIGGLVAGLPPIIQSLVGARATFKGGPRWTWSHSVDVGRAAVHALSSESMAGGTYNIVSGGPTTLGQALTHACRAYGLTSGAGMVLPAPWLVRAARTTWSDERIAALFDAALDWLWSSYQRRFELADTFHPALAKSHLALLGADLIMEGSEAERAGFLPEVTDQERAWKRTVDWYVQSGWIPSPEAVLREGNMMVQVSVPIEGTHRLQGSEPVDLPVRLDLVLKAGSWKRLWKDRAVDVTGSCYLAGLAENVACTGRLSLELRRRRLALDLDFQTDEGKTAVLKATSKLSLVEARWEAAMFVYGPLGRELSRGRLLFVAPRGLLAATSSLRLAW